MSIRISAGPEDKIVSKLQKLFKFMEEQDIEISFYYDRFFVKDLTVKDKDWELTYPDGHFVHEIPCNFKYSLSKTLELPAPREIRKKVDELPIE